MIDLPSGISNFVSGNGKGLPLWISSTSILFPVEFTPLTATTCPGNNENCSNRDKSKGIEVPPLTSLHPSNNTDAAFIRPTLSQQMLPVVYMLSY